MRYVFYAPLMRTNYLPDECSLLQCTTCSPCIQGQTWSLTYSVILPASQPCKKLYHGLQARGPAAQNFAPQHSATPAQAKRGTTNFFPVVGRCRRKRLKFERRMHCIAPMVQLLSYGAFLLLRFKQRVLGQLAPSSELPGRQRPSHMMCHSQWEVTCRLPATGL